MTVPRRDRLTPPGALLAALLVTTLVAGCRVPPPPTPSIDAHSPFPKPPNILVFLVDDLGWQDISLPLHTTSTPFNERYRTPNVERRAA